MDINAAFPSDFLKTNDLQGREVPVTIDRVEMQEVGPDKELLPVVYFRNKVKGMVLNKTNSHTISDLYGSETNNWAGQKIILWPTQTDFGGRQVACIRVKIVVPAAANPVPPLQRPPAQPIDAGEGYAEQPPAKDAFLDDSSVPF